MPRKPRLHMAGMPCHVIQRGNNREACFFCEQDYLYYLECLDDACRSCKVSLHASVLMTNHVHFLMIPSDAESVSRVMQSLERLSMRCICHRTHFSFLWLFAGHLDSKGVMELRQATNNGMALGNEGFKMKAEL